MNTEQQLRERAEAMLFKQCGNYKPGDLTWKDCIDFALDFHKQELQRIGEIYVPLSKEEAEEAEWNEIKAQRLGWFSSPYGWLKKLPLLEAKDLADK